MLLLAHWPCRPRPSAPPPTRPATSRSSSPTAPAARPTSSRASSRRSCRSGSARPFVILNRPGASGTIGITAAMRAKPDGYTLFVGYTSETVVVPQISKTAEIFGGGRFRADRHHRAGAGGADRLQERQGRQPEGLHRRGPRQPRQVHLRRRRRQPAAHHGRLDEQAERPRRPPRALPRRRAGASPT